MLRPFGQLVGEVRIRRVPRCPARDDPARGIRRGKVYDLPVHRQAQHGEGAARLPSVPGRLDGVGVSAHWHGRQRPHLGQRMHPRRLVHVTPSPQPGVGPAVFGSRGPGGGQRPRHSGEHPLAPLPARLRGGRHRSAEQLPGVVGQPAPHQGRRRRRNTRRHPLPRPVPEHRPVQPGGQRPLKTRVQQRRPRPGTKIPVPRGEQGPRRLSAGIGERPKPPEHPNPRQSRPRHRVGLHAGQRSHAQRTGPGEQRPDPLRPERLRERVGDVRRRRVRDRVVRRHHEPYVGIDRPRQRSERHGPGPFARPVPPRHGQPRPPGPERTGTSPRH